MQNLGGLFCPICLDYYAKPVTASCKHSFCQLCLQQYFLHFNTCPICQTQIRKQKPYRQSSLSNFVQNFINSQHHEYLEEYLLRIEKLHKYKQKKMLKTFVTGQKVDIRDHNYIWRQGRIQRIISRIGETYKYIKVLYLDSQDKAQQELKVISERLAEHGYYTSRTDIPKYKQIKENKNKKNIEENKP